MPEYTGNFAGKAKKRQNCNGKRKMPLLVEMCIRDSLGMPDESVKADIIYICSPNNPTGAAYTRAQLKAWVDYARKNEMCIRDRAEHGNRASE